MNQTNALNIGSSDHVIIQSSSYVLVHVLQQIAFIVGRAWAVRKILPHSHQPHPDKKPALYSREKGVICVCSYEKNFDI